MKGIGFPLLFAGLSLSVSACGTAPARVADGAAAPDRVATHCLRETGSRIPNPTGKCLASPGRVVEREELENTGTMDIGSALHRLGVL